MAGCVLAAIRATVPRIPALCCAIWFCQLLGCSKARLARALGLSRYQLSDILAEKRPVTKATALRLESVVGGSAQSWTDMQTAHHSWRA